MKRRFNLRLLVGLTVVVGGAAFGIVSGGGFASADLTNPCQGIGSPAVDNHVAAAYTTSGLTATYQFTSANMNSSGGIPGLIAYCVFPAGSSNDPAMPTSATTPSNLLGADGSQWVDPQTFDNFGWTRPGGDPTNIPLNGATVTMGTADWLSALPDHQTIVLHVNDPAFCIPFNGSNTCFVYPGTGTTTPPAADLTAGKTASPSFTRTYTWGVSKEADTAQVLSAGGGLSGPVNYTVSVTHDNGTDSGWTVTGDITVTNPNPVGDDVSGVNVTDAIDANAICTVNAGSPGAVHPANATIPGGGQIDFPYTCTYSQAPAATSQTNTATITWPTQTLADNSPLAGNASNPLTATANVDWTSVDPTIVDGSVTLTDPYPGPTLGVYHYTDPSPMTYKYWDQFKDPAGTCTSHKNTATITTSDSQTSTDSNTVTVADCQGADLNVSKDATPAFTRTYTWGIDKSADPTKVFTAGGADGKSTYTVNVRHNDGTDSGWTVTGTITVSNPNDWESVTLTGVSDAIDNGGNCSITSGDANATLAPKGQSGDSTTLGYSCTYGSAPSPAAFTNTATATWDASAASTPDGSADGTATGAFGTPTTIVDGSVSVTDSVAGTLGTVSYTDPSPTTYQYDGAVSGPAGTCTDNKNTATFTTSDTQTPGSASATVTDCQGADLKVSKTATPSFTRTYAWSISKSVDKTLVEKIGGGTATFNYTVKAGETGFTDSAWKVTGSITVSNPNDWEAVTVNLTDAIDNGGSCSVVGGSSVSIPASGSKTFSYTCTYSSAPSPASFTNTATATWDKTAASTPTGSASGTATGTFGSPTTTVNKTITVVDTFNGVPTTLGTLTATDSVPFASATYTYSRTVNVPTSNCVKYTNTAKIVETGQQGSKTIEVCGPASTGGLTIGFWNNKNGQGIIGAANQSALGTWLRQFHPFSDAPSSGLASYVSTIITAATCSGPTSSPCNKMLRAQMLATALNVYFSNAALGGNKINAPAPIGGVTIDLTMICQMIDGSGGTATCSGTFENVSSAFGSATSMTVLNMLLYQNTSDPAADAGAVWYGNVKAAQVLAKDAFDAINNRVAFAP